MPKRTENTERTCKAEGCGAQFVATHGRLLYCPEHRSSGASSAAKKTNGAAVRKTREDAKLDRILDAPVGTKSRKRTQRRKPAAEKIVHVIENDLARQAQEVLEFAGFTVTGTMRTPKGVMLSIELGGAS